MIEIKDVSGNYGEVAGKLEESTAIIATLRAQLAAETKRAESYKALVERVASIKDQHPPLLRWVADCKGAIIACREAVRGEGK